MLKIPNLIDLYEWRNCKIYADFKSGMRQKVIAKNNGLSESRTKAIIAEQKRKHAEQTNLR